MFCQFLGQRGVEPVGGEVDRSDVEGLVVHLADDLDEIRLAMKPKRTTNR